MAKYGPVDRFWVVVNPTTDSGLSDILFAASISDLYLQFKGGLDLSTNLTLFTDQDEALKEAELRLSAEQAKRAILAGARPDPSPEKDSAQAPSGLPSFGKCQDCREIWEVGEMTPLEQIKDLVQRIAPGEEVPAGECPRKECGALCQVVEGEYINHCPECTGPIYLIGFEATSKIVVLPDGWSLGEGPIDTDDETFSCGNCDRIVPSDWVFANMTRKEALDFMKKSNG